MDLPSLTPRLQLIADLVSENSTVADVGTDHGYIPVYLVNKGICPFAYAGDIGEGPLENAMRTIERFGCKDRVTAVLSPGLEKFPFSCADTVIVAGMGGEQIAQIVSDCEWVKKSDVTLILQPMSMQEKMRVILAENGFFCEKEEYVKEGRRLYSVMVYHYSHSHVLDEVTAQIGLALQSDSPLAKEYVAGRIKKLLSMAEGMEKSEDQKEEAVKIRELISKISVEV